MIFLSMIYDFLSMILLALYNIYLVKPYDYTFLGMCLIFICCQISYFYGFIAVDNN